MFWGAAEVRPGPQGGGTDYNYEELPGKDVQKCILKEIAIQSQRKKKSISDDRCLVARNRKYTPRPRLRRKPESI